MSKNSGHPDLAPAGMHWCSVTVPWGVVEYELPVRVRDMTEDDRSAYLELFRLADKHETTVTYSTHRRSAVTASQNRDFSGRRRQKNASAQRIGPGTSEPRRLRARLTGEMSRIRRSGPPIVATFSARLAARSVPTLIFSGAAAGRFW